MTAFELVSLKNIKDSFITLFNRAKEVFKTMVSHKHCGETDLNIRIGLSALDEMRLEFEGLDERLATGDTTIAKQYIILHRALETIRILFIYYGNEYKMKTSIEDLQNLIEKRVKEIAPEMLVSLLRHDVLYGSSRYELLESPLVSRYLKRNKKGVVIC